MVEAEGSCEVMCAPVARMFLLEKMAREKREKSERPLNDHTKKQSVKVRDREGMFQLLT